MHIHLGTHRSSSSSPVTFVLVLGRVGYFLKGNIRTSSDFLLSKRDFSHWVTGIAFMSANLGALEIMGQTANRRKVTGCARTTGTGWAAIPAMLFLGMFMDAVLTIRTAFAACPSICALRFDYRAHLPELESASHSLRFLMAGH